jgi:hypothetical protein
MRGRASWGILGLLLLASVVARSLAGLRVDGLWIVPDEMIWGGIGRSLWEHGSLRLFGGDAPFFGLVYPALVGAPLALAGLDAGYDALKVVQAVIVSLAAVPVFLWCRRLAGDGWALVAGALTLAIPELLYSGMLLSEVAFYPAAVLAAWATAEALERPTYARQALLVGVIVLAVATRLQALVLPLAVLTAIGLQAAFERDLRAPRRLWPVLAAFGMLAGGWVAWRMAAAGSLSGALGGYAPAATAPYEVGKVARSVLDHAGALVLATGIFPVCAVALLVGRERSRAGRAYVATTLSLSFWLLLQTGAYASVYVEGGLSGRYLMPLAPLLFVGLALWLARGAPRTRVSAAVVALGAFAVLAAMPLRDLIVQEAAWQSPAVIALLWLKEQVGEDRMELITWSGAAAALTLFALVPRRLALVFPVLAAALLAFSSFAATREVQQNIAFDQRNLLGGERAWIDAAADGPVAYVDLGTAYSNLVWHQLFWNDRLRHVYVPAGAEPEAGYPLQERVHVATDGTLTTDDGGRPQEGFVVAPSAVRFIGEPLAAIEIREYEGIGLTLWRLDPPARLSSQLVGVRRDGDMHGPASLMAYDCAGGRLELTLLWKAATRVDLRVNGELVRTLRASGEGFVSTTVDPPAGAEVCRFEVIPDSLLGSTRFEFVRD